jgi:hypothetical protein
MYLFLFKSGRDAVLVGDRWRQIGRHVLPRFPGRGVCCACRDGCRVSIQQWRDGHHGGTERTIHMVRVRVDRASPNEPFMAGWVLIPLERLDKLVVQLRGFRVGFLQSTVVVSCYAWYNNR